MIRRAIAERRLGLSQRIHMALAEFFGRLSLSRAGGGLAAAAAALVLVLVQQPVRQPAIPPAATEFAIDSPYRPYSDDDDYGVSASGGVEVAEALAANQLDGAFNQPDDERQGSALDDASVGPVAPGGGLNDLQMSDDNEEFEEYYYDEDEFA